ncbi:MAG TPA: hypothetical protein DCZ94_04340 [Lentisphaeria bacterium]|nr:MAG: hypothetical protein A2X48_05565 [Lentisphaerae bacterium GWF2_49_21]HBC86165.1 hypothetical protein [Lentisphaeria bacterium]
MKRYDVIVAGAGVAGIAAALECARSGMKTALVEKTILPGGLATSGMVNIYLPLCDGKGRQVIHGISEELLKASIKYCPGSIPAGWGGVPGEKDKRYLAVFNPSACVLAFDELLEQKNLDIWYDTQISGAAVKGSKLTSLEVLNKSGKLMLEAGCFIDATGDADIANFAGAECEEGSNSLSLWAMNAYPDKQGAAVAMIRFGADDSGRGHPKNAPVLKGTSGKDTTTFVLESRKLLRNHYANLKDGRTRETEYPVCLPTMAQFRTTRKIKGLASVRNDAFNKNIDDSVGIIPEWRFAGKTWEVPYGSLIPVKIKGLLAVGRCMDAEKGDAWNVARVIPCAALTGQVAGISAVLSVEHETSPDNIDLKDIRNVLDKRGILYHL